MYKNTAFFAFILCCFWSCKREPIELTHRSIQLPTTLNLSNICFINDSVGFITAGSIYSKGELYRTTDAGDTWEKIVAMDYAFSQVAKGGNRLFLITDSNVLWRSDDGGSGWQGSLMANWTFWHAADFRNDGTGVVIGGKNFGEGYVQRIDSSSQWTSHDTMKNEWHDVRIVNDSVVYLVGYGAIRKSTDGGVSWQSANIGGDDFVRISFVSDNEAFVLGWYGSLWHSIDAGETWKQLHKANTMGKRRQNDMCWLDNQTGFLVGDDGLIERSSNAGKHWNPVNTDTQGTDWNAVCAANNKLWVVGSQGAILVVDI